MNSGDKIQIINIDNMWDKEIYFYGYGLNQTESIKDELFNELNSENYVYPIFEKCIYFKNGDKATLRVHGIHTFNLEIEIIDRYGNKFICESQNFSETELELFCKII